MFFHLVPRADAFLGVCPLKETNKPLHIVNQKTKEKGNQNMRNDPYIEDSRLLLLQTEIDEEKSNTIPDHQLREFVEYIEDFKDLKEMQNRLGDELGIDYLRHDLWNLKEKINKTKQDETLHPEVAKLYKKLDHAIYYEEEAIIRKLESYAILGQLFTDIHCI